MHWGVRRYQNADGSYTAAGKEHYGIKGVANTVKSKVQSAAKKVTEAEVYGKGGKVAKAVSKANYSAISATQSVSKKINNLINSASKTTANDYAKKNEDFIKKGKANGSIIDETTSIRDLNKKLKKNTRSIA